MTPVAVNQKGTHSVDKRYGAGVRAALINHLHRHSLSVAGDVSYRGETVTGEEYDFAENNFNCI